MIALEPVQKPCVSVSLDFDADRQLWVLTCSCGAQGSFGHNHDALAKRVAEAHAAECEG